LKGRESAYKSILEAESVCRVHECVIVIVSTFVGHDTALRAKKSACKALEELVKAVRPLAKSRRKSWRGREVSLEAFRLCKGLESACRGPLNANRGRESVVEAVKVPVEA
jgi:hypothetical protein